MKKENKKILKIQQNKDKKSKQQHKMISALDLLNQFEAELKSENFGSNPPELFTNISKTNKKQ